MNDLTSSMVERPTARVIGRESKARGKQGDFLCTIGTNIKVNATHLGQYCSGEMDARSDDLVVLAGVVAFADRTLRRATSRCWARELHISVPVLDLAFWKQSSVHAELRELLNLLTGDVWHLAFTQRHDALDCEPQSNLGLRNIATPYVMPYSDGMDSFAVARLLNESEPDVPLIMVTTGGRRDADAEAEKGRWNSQRFRFAVPFRVRGAKGSFRELSFRSRALIYATMGAIAAKMAGAKKIIVSESGQGALGPWLAPVGNEADDLRMHPLLTSKMSRFMSKVLGADLAFDHPRLWSTKAQTLRELVRINAAQDVENTRSCARDARHGSHDGLLRQCGVCAACLLRRVSMYEAGIREPSTTYLWTDLGAPTMDQGAQKDLPEASANDVDQAAWGVMAMQQLADVPKESLSSRAWALAKVMECTAAEVETRLHELVGQHADEWNRFVDAQGKRSFLRQWMP